MTRPDRRKGKKVTFLGLEALEGREILSTSAGPIAPIAGDLLARGIASVDLTGTAQGTPSTVVGNPDVGTTVNFRGVAHLQGLGSLQLKGSLHGTGFLASSHVEGLLTLANARGSLLLQVQSPQAGGFTAPDSGVDSFTITRGTGAFQHDFGRGSIALKLGAGSFTMTFLGRPKTD